MILLAVRPCGCAIASVRSDSPEVPYCRATWAARDFTIVAVPDATVTARLLADFATHTAGHAVASAGTQLQMELT